MSVANDFDHGAMSIQECQRLGPPLRQELEILDYEIRRLFARTRADALLAGAENSQLMQASSTVMLSIAAELVARAAEDRGQSFDAKSFIASANSAAQWAHGRRLRYFLSGEA